MAEIIGSMTGVGRSTLPLKYDTLTMLAGLPATAMALTALRNAAKELVKVVTELANQCLTSVAMSLVVPAGQ